MDRPTGSSHLAFTMAGLVAAGGVSGFVQRRSTPSLVAGLGIASLFAYGGYTISVSPPTLLPFFRLQSRM